MSTAKVAFHAGSLGDDPWAGPTIRAAAKTDRQALAPKVLDADRGHDQ